MDSGGVDYASRIHRSFFLAGFSVLAYDHLLTLPMEAKYIWKSKLRPSTLWFLLLRYTCLISSIWMYTFYFVVFDYEPISLFLNYSHLRITFHLPSPTVATHVLKFLIESTLIVRVFAMYGRNPWILAALGAQVLFVPAISLWGNINNGRPQMLNAPGPGMPGCHYAIPRTTALRLAGTWGGLIACDVFVFLLTLWKAYTQRRSNSALMYRSTTLVERMWRDGAMYFGMIVLVNTANLLTFYFGDVGFCSNSTYTVLALADGYKILLAGFLSWPASNLAITLLSRLILNLHEAWHIGIETEEPNTMNLETLRFQIRTDNDAKFGAFLEFVGKSSLARTTSRDTSAYAIQLVTQVNYGPILSKKFFATAALAGGDEPFVEITEAQMLELNLRKENTYKNFRSKEENKFYELNLYLRDPTTKHHWRAGQRARSICENR
ncbi:hypothetical protein C8J57DRAFT_1502119 [Mycena rebaudengoi]|nr:hypothetical protein C8J57DRAFT_1502119 [Mycena rebaudengoi]